MLDHELSQELFLVAEHVLTRGRDAGAELRRGVRVLDRWSDGLYGGVLFWVSRELDVWCRGKAALQTVRCALMEGRWQSRGGSGASGYTAAEIRARTGPGLHRLGTSSGDPLRLTTAIATPDVSSIRLRSDVDVSQRQPGVDGFCLFGITHQDPITYAHAFDADGVQLSGEALLL